MPPKKKKVARKKTTRKKTTSLTKRKRKPGPKRARRKKKPAFQISDEFKENFKAKLVQLSVLFNVIIFAIGVFALVQAGPVHVFQTTLELIQAPFQVKEKTTQPKSPPKATVKPVKKQVTPRVRAPQPVAEVIQRKVKVRKPRTNWTSKPKIVLVIDDMGNTASYKKELIALEDKVTYAILPLLRFSRTYSEISLQTGAEVILHLPFEASTGDIPGPGLLTSRMGKDQIIDVLRRDLQSVPYRVGVNNHMGSFGTTNTHLMGTVLSELKNQNFFFLDSVTTQNTVTEKISTRIGLPHLKRDVFLDNVDTQTAIRLQMRKLAQVASRKGHAIGIGHYRYNTLVVMKSEIDRLEAQGYEFISLQDLLDYREWKSKR